MIVIAWVLIAVSVFGFGVTFPLWLADRITDRQMLGLTLALSWAAIWYSAVLFLFEAKRSKREKNA